MTNNPYWLRKLTEGRLLVSDPEYVARELDRYGDEIAASALFPCDEDMEKTLLARDNPVVDLALARNASSRQLVASLYRRAAAPERDTSRESYWRALRIACLANRDSAGSLSGLRGTASWMTDAEATALWTRADEAECQTLLVNPAIGTRTLVALYRSESPFANVEETRRAHLVSMSADNPRLGDQRDSVDGPDLGLWDVQEAIFGMVCRSPLTRPWLFAAHQLLMTLDPYVVRAPSDLNPALSHWARYQPPDEGFVNEGYYTGLPLHRELRCLIGAHYGRIFVDGKSHTCGSPDSEDEALRAAYYANTELTLEAAEVFLSKDRAIFSFAVLFHKYALHTPKLRGFIEEQCVHRDTQWLYRQRCQQISRNSPRFDPRPLSEWMRESASANDDVEDKRHTELRARIDHIGKEMNHRLQNIQTILLWGLLILGVALWWR